MKKLLVTITILLFNLYIQAQDIYWATKVDSVSSEYSDDEAAAFTILGLPNVDKRGRWSAYAWAVEPNKINTEGIETAYIDVTFGTKAIMANQLAVFESFNPGAVSEIFIQGYRDWERVYVDTFVLAKTGFVTFDGKIDEDLKKVLGTVKKDWNLVVKDHEFQSQKGSNILRVKFEAQEVLKVRIVLNTLAIDGWNQIDAVALASDKYKKEIDYPQINLADKSLLTEREAQNMGEYINTPYAEINPVLSPNGKELYFSRSFYDKAYYAETQHIFVSDYNANVLPECYRRKDMYYEETELWEPAAPYSKKYNNIIPNELFAFTNNGNKLYFNNLYTNEVSDNSDSIFFKNTAGISESIKDTVFWKNASSEQVESLQKYVLPNYKALKVNKEETVLLMVVEDSLTKAQSLFTNVKLQEKWLDSPILLGSLENQNTFPLNYSAQAETARFIFYVDTLNSDSLKVGNIEWHDVQDVKIKNFQNNSKYINLFVTPNDETMFLAIANDKSKGERDLFYSNKQADGSWSEPQSMGNVLNTINDEDAPFLDEDGVSLYFASAGHSGYGEMDIYVSRKIGEGWDKWSKPKNLGSKVNTGGSENGFIISPKTRVAYYSSTTKTVGCNDMADLYEIQMSKPIILVFKGKTLNVDTQEPISEAEVTLKALDENGEEAFSYATMISDEYNGNFSIKLHELVDANKLSNFALIARKEYHSQTNKKGDTIVFDVANINPNSRIITINRNLYLRTDENIAKTPKKREQDSLIIVHTDIVDPKTVVDTAMEQVVDTKIEILQPKDMITCDVLFYNGNMYLVPPPNKDGSLTKVQYLEDSYFKEFDYNQFDFSINEGDFEKMIQKIVERQKIFGTLTIHIVASASRVPTKVYDSNQDLAEKRASEAITRIKLAMQKHNIDENNITFKEHTYVQGPKYTKDLTKEDYMKHQYIKIWVVGCFDK